MADEKPPSRAELELGAPVASLTGGQFVFNRYSLVKLVGRGRVSAVWQAWDSTGNRDVALKFLPASLHENAAALADIKAAATKVQSLKIAQVAKIYGFEQEDQLSAVVMEYVEGNSLDALRLQKKNQVFEAADLKEWIRQFCVTLANVHSQTKLVHGALKPTNLVVDAKGALIVSDFAIERVIGDWVNKQQGAQDVSHNLRYSSPQQAMGQESVVTDDV